MTQKLDRKATLKAVDNRQEITKGYNPDSIIQARNPNRVKGGYNPKELTTARTQTTQPPMQTKKSKEK